LGAFVGVLGFLGLLVAVVMLIIKVISKKGWEYKKIGILAGTALVLFIVGMAVSPSAKEGYEAGQQAAKEGNTVAPASSPMQEQNNEENQARSNVNTKPKLSWNTEDLNIETNGNVSVAIDFIKELANPKQTVEAVTPTESFKAPWKYYGKIIKVTGLAAIVQEYPPGSDLYKATGGECGEIVLVTDDGTYIDYLHIGSTGKTKVGDAVVLYGTPVGQVEADNKLGGKTTELVIVGKTIEAVPTQ
jgi:hypothetical protein